MQLDDFQIWMCKEVDKDFGWQQCDSCGHQTEVPTTCCMKCGRATLINPDVRYYREKFRNIESLADCLPSKQE
jgi:ribosomal protein L32